MTVYKTWKSKGGGIKARFYSSNGGYFLDFNNCIETVQVLVQATPKQFLVTFMYDVPVTYKKFITKWFQTKYMKENI
jgi:hypothetical protein